MEHNNLSLTILRAIRTLTPPNVMECSTQEICALMAEDGIKRDVRSVASLIGGFKRDGLVISRTYMQRKLWKLTAQGKRWLAEHDRARRNGK